VPQGDVTSLGSAIFAFMVAGAFKTIEEAQDALCPKYKVFEPDPASVSVYEELFPLYKKLYFAFGQKDSAAARIGDVLPAIRRIAAEVRAT
jgi:L-ribulokinase